MLTANQRVRLVHLDRVHALVLEQYVGKAGKVIDTRDGYKFTVEVEFGDGARSWFAEQELEEIV